MIQRTQRTFSFVALAVILVGAVHPNIHFVTNATATSTPAPSVINDNSPPPCPQEQISPQLICPFSRVSSQSTYEDQQQQQHKSLRSKEKSVIRNIKRRLLSNNDAAPKHAKDEDLLRPTIDAYNHHLERRQQPSPPQTPPVVQQHDHDHDHDPELNHTAVPLAPSTFILPQNEPNASLRVFPYTPMTGANNSLYLTPNITSTDGLVQIKVGVLLPYSLPNDLTQQLSFSGTSAIRMAAGEINANKLIPGAYITLVLKDSFNGADPENSGAGQAIFSTVSLLQAEGGVSGVIGDVSSALTVQSALLTSRLSIPQCSFSAGSTQLSSKDYGHFFRTIPTELMFGRVMIDFVASRGWKTMAVFYTGDSLGSEMMENISKQAKLRDINIGFRRTFWNAGSSSDVGPVLDRLKDSGQRIIVVAAVGVPQIKLMAEAVRRGLVSKDYVWLTIDQVTDPLLEIPGITTEQLNGLFMFDNMLELHGYPPYEEFLDKWSELDPKEFPYSGSREISSNEAQAYSCMMVMANGFANAVKGNWTALHMLATGRLGSKLKPLSMNTNYTGPGGPMLFDEFGDVVYGNFILYNYQHGHAVVVGNSYSGVFNVSSPPMYFDGTYDTPADSAPLRVLNPMYGSTIGVVIMIIAGLGILFSLVTMVIVVLHRDAQVIKASSPLFCCFELCGFMLLYVSAILGLDIPNHGTCVARPLTLNIGFLLVVSNIVAKNFRVYRIFHNIYVTKRVIRDSHLLKIVGTIMTVNLAIMTTWFIKVPPMMEQVTMGDLTTYFTCNIQSKADAPFFGVLFAYNVSLLLVATYLAYQNRNVAANYNECRQIAFVVYNILLSGCIALPTLFLPRDQYFTSFFLSNIVVLFGTTVSLMFMFLPKLLKLFSEFGRQSLHGNTDISEERSIDSFLNNRVGGSGGWLSNVGAGGSSVGGAGASTVSNNAYSTSGGRKGSIVSIDDRGDTLREAHMGYMGVKFQNRYLPFLASWCMRRVILYPTDKYFTCFEVGKPESGRTYSFVSVEIHSREQDNYILRVVGKGRFNFLLQVKDEERLQHWHSLFDNKTGGGGATYSTRSKDHSRANSTVRRSHFHRESKSSANSGYNDVSMMLAMRQVQTRSESDETLNATMYGLHHLMPRLNNSVRSSPRHERNNDLSQFGGGTSGDGTDPGTGAGSGAGSGVGHDSGTNRGTSSSSSSRGSNEGEEEGVYTGYVGVRHQGLPAVSDRFTESPRHSLQEP